jgi:hypothetical protein
VGAPGGSGICDHGAVSVDSPETAPAVAESRRSAHIPQAVLSLLAGGVLAAGCYVGTIGQLVAVAVVQVVLVMSWVIGSALPGRIGAVVMGVLASGATDWVVTRWQHDGYAPILGVLGVAVPAMFIHQLTRGVVRTRVVESLADITILLIAVTSIAGLMLLRHQSNGDRTTLAVIGALGVALAVSHLTDAVLAAPRFDPEVDRGLPAVVLGVLAGAAVGLIVLRSLIDFTGGRGAFVGAAVAAVGCLLSIGTSFAGAHSTLDADADRSPWVLRLRPVAAVLMTIALSAPAGYVLINAVAS